MPIINPITDKRRRALDIILSRYYEYDLLNDADLFQCIADSGYYWDEAEQDWKPMPETKEG